MLSLLIKNWREGAIGGLVVVILFLFVQWKKADADLKTAKLAYENPQIKEVVREVKVQGPVKIVYRRTREPLYGEEWEGVDEPNGKAIPQRTRETVEKIVYRDTVKTEKDTGKETTPIPVSVILTPKRSDRWLLSFGVNKLSMDTDGKAILAGYGFRNRLDLTAGIIRTDHPTGWIFTTFRF